MSLTVSGVTNNSGTQPVKGSTAPTDETDGLFGTEETKGTDKAANDEKRTLLEAELAKYEAQLKALEAQKATKTAYKKELEAQKRAIEAQKSSVEAQIKANEDAMRANEQEITKNEENIKKAQEDIEKLQKEYDAKNKEANELSKQVSEKISKIIEDSEYGIKAQQEEIQAAYEEANEKVASGEIKEDEVAQYVMNKVGNGQVKVSSEDLASINSLNGQVRALIANANSISDQMDAKQVLIQGYQAAITSCINSNEALQQKNEPLKKQVASFNKQISTLNSEINKTDKEINVIDKNIAQVNVNIQTVQNEINELDGKETSEVVEADVPDVSEDVPGKKDKTDKGSEPAVTSKSSKANPFLSVSYDLTSYANMTEALEAMARSNEQNLSSARNQAENNRQEVRRMFQDILG